MRQRTLTAPLWLVEKFYKRTHGAGYQAFSSDEFRELGLDVYFADNVHEIGGFFSAMRQEGHIEDVGRKASQLPANNRRSIKMYRWTVAAHLHFGAPQGVRP